MIGWVDASSGASGDMLLAAVVDAGADGAAVQAAIDAVAPEPVKVSFEPVTRASLAAVRAAVRVGDSTTERGLHDVLVLLDVPALDPVIAEHAREVFALLAEAEAAVHAKPVDQAHFHEVGALDAIADVVGVCAGFVALGLSSLHCSPVAVGSGSTDTAHGTMSVPPPAVVRLLTGVPTYGGPVSSELCTPTGAALLRHWVGGWGPQPPMTVRRAGVGAGSRDLPGRANVLRLLVGDVTSASLGAVSGLVLETNVDDLDPRLWPHVLQRLLDCGASDAWLSPILMKKGRPAQTLSVLAPPECAERVRAVIFTETTAIGLRERAVTKYELDRASITVSVGGERIAVKVARLDGEVVNVQPEYDDVAAAAARLGRPVKSVLAAAAAAVDRG
ncbi:MAG TPA: nickel pincer cofactor biosynthesis protein LarC [Nocardioidaceae bacterium]|nr:nickel pincer cofactor biosynthesis protein LarC [Nocardioidaceae bacterium]